MARRRRKAAAGGLFTLQAQTARLGLSWLELSLGAAEVIATRTAMLGEALARPDGLTDPEFTRMVIEKPALGRGRIVTRPIFRTSGRYATSDRPHLRYGRYPDAESEGSWHDGDHDDRQRHR